MKIEHTQHFYYILIGDTLNAGGESRIGYAAQERDEDSRYIAMGIMGRISRISPHTPLIPLFLEGETRQDCVLVSYTPSIKRWPGGVSKVESISNN
jgi:hypothetical protein